MQHTFSFSCIFYVFSRITSKKSWVRLPDGRMRLHTHTDTGCDTKQESGSTDICSSCKEFEVLSRYEHLRASISSLCLGFSSPLVLLEFQYEAVWERERERGRTRDRGTDLATSRQLSTRRTGSSAGAEHFSFFQFVVLRILFFFGVCSFEWLRGPYGQIAQNLPIDTWVFVAPIFSACKGRSAPAWCVHALSKGDGSPAKVPSCLWQVLEFCSPWSTAWPEKGNDTGTTGCLEGPVQRVRKPTTCALYLRIWKLQLSPPACMSVCLVACLLPMCMCTIDRQCPQVHTHLQGCRHEGLSNFRSVQWYTHDRC